MAVIKVPYKKTNSVVVYSTITFPNIEDLEENNALRKADFYIIFKKSGGTTYSDNPLHIGKIEDLIDRTINESELPFTISSSSVAMCYLVFKFDDDTLNNSSNDELITATRGDTNIFKSEYNGYVGLYNYFCFMTSAPLYCGGSSNYNISNILGGVMEDEEIEPIEPTYKDITLTLFKDNKLNGVIKSNIELFYSIDNIELVRLGTSQENDSFIINFDTSKQVYLYFKYINENIDLSKCIETFQLDNTDVYSVYNSELMLFSLGSITENDTLRERKYATNIIDVQLTNATINTNEIDYTHDTLIEIKAKPNYFFNIEPFIYYDRGAYSTQTETFTLNEDRTIATLLISAKDPLNNFYHYNLVAVAEVNTIISQDYGLITIYKPNNEILKELPSKTLYVDSYTTSNNGVHIETLDLSKNILGCLSIPLDINSVGSKEITLQGKPTSLISDYIDNNIYKIDFGYVDIQGIYNNSIDYKNTKLSIYLPFISMQSLDVNKYMNKKVYLSYTVDLFTGDFLAELKVNNLITDTFSGNLAIKVPYITNSEKSQNVSNYNLLDKNNLLSDRVPKIIIETNTINSDTIFNTLEYKQLNSLTGFNSIENLVIPSEVKINASELEQLESVLKNGVIF